MPFANAAVHKMFGAVTEDLDEPWETTHSR
jgi:hypothetical protein